MDEALEAEAHAQAIALTSVDGREAIAAFRDKREPHFQGR